jgi:hypothetical protein
MRKVARFALAAGLAAAGAQASSTTIAEIERLDAVVEGGGTPSYDPADRRDPFVDPTVREAEPATPPGLAGTAIGEARLQGLSLVGGEPTALLLGSDGVGYTARAGEALRDGRVADIDFGRGVVVFEQRLEGPRGGQRRVERRLQPP